MASGSRLNLQSDADHRSGSLRGLVRSRRLAAALICVLLGSVDLTVVAAVMPQMIADLGVNTADIDRYIWIVSGYLIAYIVAIPLVGRVSDLIGRKTAFMICLGVFVVGSLLCASADSLTQLVVGRMVQGLGGGGLLPITIALVGDELSPHFQLAGIGIVGAIETIGWVLGPIYGATIIELMGNRSGSWRWIFWINIPLLLGALLLVARGFVRAQPRSSTARQTSIDVPGALLLILSLVSINLALASGGEFGATRSTGLRAMGGTPNPLADRIPALLAICLISTTALVIWERRATSPLLPVSLYRQRRFIASILGNAILGAVLMVSMVNVPVAVALLSTPDVASRTSAIMLAPFTLTIAMASFLTGNIVERLGPEWTSRLGILLVVTGCGVQYVLLIGDILPTMVPGLALSGFGIGMLLPPLGAVILGVSSASDRGAAASSALMFRLLGMTIGVSAMTAAGVHRLQVLTGRLDPIVQRTGESTASFLNRQRIFIEDHAIPLSVLVIRETFAAAAIVAATLVVPLVMLRESDPDVGNKR